MQIKKLAVISILMCLMSMAIIGCPSKNPTGGSNPTPTPTTCSTLGTTSYTTDVGINNAMLSQAVTLSAPATLQAIDFRLYQAPTPGYNIKAGIYSDSSNYPNTIVAISTPTAPGNGWNEYTVGPVSLASGVYWMTLEDTGGHLDFSRDSGGSQPSLIVAGDFPTTYPASGASTMTIGNITAYLKFCP